MIGSVATTQALASFAEAHPTNTTQDAHIAMSNEDVLVGDLGQSKLTQPICDKAWELAQLCEKEGKAPAGATPLYWWLIAELGLLNTVDKPKQKC